MKLQQRINTIWKTGNFQLCLLCLIVFHLSSCGGCSRSLYDDDLIAFYESTKDELAYLESYNLSQKYGYMLISYYDDRFILRSLKLKEQEIYASDEDIFIQKIRDLGCPENDIEFLRVMYKLLIRENLRAIQYYMSNKKLPIIEIMVDPYGEYFVYTKDPNYRHHHSARPVFKSVDSLAFFYIDTN